MLRKRASEGYEPRFFPSKNVALCVFHIWLELISVRIHFTLYPNKRFIHTPYTQTKLLVVPDLCFTQRGSYKGDCGRLPNSLLLDLSTMFAFADY